MGLFRNKAVLACLTALCLACGGCASQPEDISPLDADGLIVLTIGTADTGGTMTPVGTAIAQVLSTDQLKFNISTSTGSFMNIQNLSSGEIDLGLVAEPKPQKNIVFIPITQIEDIFAATPSYLENLRLREGGDSNIFQSGNIMLLDKNNIDEYMSLHQITVNNYLEVTTMDLLIEFARIGLGIGCVIKEFVKEDLEQGKLIQLPLEPPIRKRTVGFVYHSGRTTRALETFLDYCRETHL